MIKTRTGEAALSADKKDSIKFDEKEKADILQKQFVSVSTREPGGNIPTLDAKTKNRKDVIGFWMPKQ